MPPFDHLLAFAAALLVLQLTPGPDMMLVIGRGVGQGRRVALATVVGMIFVSGALQVSLLVLGVAAALAAWPAGLQALRWIGAAYLAWLGLRLLAASRSGSGRPATPSPVSARTAVLQGALNNLTNPKAFLFMFAFVPQFVDPAAGPVWLQLLVLGAAQKLSGFVVLGLVALASGSVGRALQRWPRLRVWQPRFTGAVMLALALRLLLADASAVAAPRAPGLRGGGP